MQRGDVTEANDGTRIPFISREINSIEQPHQAVAASSEEEASKRRIAEPSMEDSEFLFICSGEVAIARSDVGSEFHLETPVADFFGCDGDAILVGRRREGENSDLVPSP